MRSQLAAIADGADPRRPPRGGRVADLRALRVRTRHRRVRVRDRRRHRPVPARRPRGRSSWSHPADAPPAPRGRPRGPARAHAGRHPAGPRGLGPHRRASAAGRASPSTPGCSAAPSGATTTARCRGRSPTRSTTPGTATARPARPRCALLVGATPEAERELWRHLCEIDWVQTVSAGNRGVDDPLPLFLDDGRAAVALDHFDCIWARLLDVPAALGARRAEQPASVVVEVTDDLGLRRRAAGASTSRPTAPRSRPRTATADVVAPRRRARRPVPRRPLGGPASHEAGWIDEATPGGVARLDAALRTATAPWSPTTY